MKEILLKLIDVLLTPFSEALNNLLIWYIDNLKNIWDDLHFIVIKKDFISLLLGILRFIWIFTTNIIISIIITSILLVGISFWIVYIFSLILIGIVAFWFFTNFINPILNGLLSNKKGG